MCFGLKKIVKIYESGNVITCGLIGRGKDMLTANVIARRKVSYISNMDYHCAQSEYIPLDFSKIDVKNTYENFISGSVVPYEYEYPENADFYITDAGVYFPAQSERDLCRKFPTMPVFQALSRHLGNCRFHCNVQNLNRLWDKIREQADNYIICNWCKVLFKKLVIMKVTVYDKYQSCVDRVKPFKPLLLLLALQK